MMLIGKLSKIKTTKHFPYVGRGGVNQHMENSICFVVFIFESFPNDVGAKFRYEFKYYTTKMKEAEQNGFAKDEVKDYDYWSKLFNQIFRSDKSGTEVTEDLRYFLGKMKETHLCEK